MSSGAWYRGLLAGALTAALLSGCDDRGTHNGPCYPNGTCNAGLFCVNGQCVAEGAISDAGPRPDGAPGDGPTKLDHQVKPDTVKPQPITPWVATITGPLPLFPEGIAARGSELILAGRLNGTTKATVGMVVVKLDGKGSPGWQKRYTTGSLDTGGPVALAGAKDYLICGESSGNIWLVRIDNTGKVLWQRRYKDTSKTTTHARIALPVAGGFVVAGGSTVSLQTMDLLIFKINDDGDLQWQKRLKGSGLLTVRGGAVLSDGGTVLVGHIDDGTDIDVFVVRLNSNGGIIWQKEVGGSDWDLGGDVVEMPNKDLVVLASTRSWGSGNNDLWFLRFSPAGKLQTQQVQGGPGNDIGDRLFSATGGLLVAGDTESHGAGVVDFFATKWSSGKLLWQRRFGEAKWDYIAAATAVQGESLAIFGYTDVGPGSAPWIIGVVGAAGNLPAGCALGGGTKMNSGSTAAQVKQLQLSSVPLSMTYVTTNAAVTSINLQVTKKCQ